MELILYYIIKCKNLLISFLILMFILGIFAYIAMRNFRQDKKMKIFFYGLFLGAKDIDILKMSIIVVKTFLAFYATIVTDELLMWLCIIMICISTFVYIVCSYKRIIYQVFSTIMQVVLIYFIDIINIYMIEIEETSIILMIKICLTGFALLITTYLFFSDIDIITQDRVDKNFKKEKNHELY